MAWVVERLQTGSTVAGLERRSDCGGGEQGGSWRRGELAGPGWGVPGSAGGGGDGGHQRRARGISNLEYLNIVISTVEYLNVVYKYRRLHGCCVSVQ